ncbi:cilia- and flagella-associated protein 418 isoform X2 [Amphiprion ocellaris]|uniref:cilia- and flagella-associated protein 418 isoform X2 n=1 Tax=Amphiprion ocellaris TaxID=80972 RepID=UPI000C318DB1|nr:cilia- and flagella-associated protein 418 isoform X2 [Amphiprion ocellaris]
MTSQKVRCENLLNCVAKVPEDEKISVPKPKQPISSVSEDIDALLEELREEDPRPKTELCPKGSQVEKKLPPQSAGRKCCPVYVGGSSVTNGVGTATSKRSCDQLRCISCDFKVLMFDDCEWDPSCDYLFLRNNMPDREKLRTKLKKRRSLRAYACQCSWFSTLEPTDLRDQPQLKWQEEQNDGAAEEEEEDEENNSRSGRALGIVGSLQLLPPVCPEEN